MDRNAVYIPSIDAKDLFMANNFIKKESSKMGFRLKRGKGDFNYNRFINSLDFSLDLIHLREIAKDRIPANESFSFEYLNKEFSDKVINVTFKYSYKEFNKIKKDTYVADGYQLADLNFVDGIAINTNKEVVGVITNTPVTYFIENLPPYFSCETNPAQEKLYKVKTIPVKKTVEELRHYLYENGFVCEGRKYVRFKRSSGSARVGKCLFIDKRLYDDIHKWEMCGLEVDDGDEIDLAALEAYISLPTSSIIDTLEINPKSILVIPDYESEFEDDCIVTEIGEDKWLHTTEKKTIVSNSIFDGQSLIDPSIMGDYSKYGMVLLRNRFFKSCCFNTNISKWFKDNHITSLSQLHKDSITLAEKIEDIKLITTASSIKYAKFRPILDWLKLVESTFGVVKHEKKTHFFKGNMVQAHYQLLNTVRLSQEETRDFLKPSLDYVTKLNTIPEVFRYHIKHKILEDNDELDNFDFSIKDKNDVFYKMSVLSNRFTKTKLYYDFKRETCKAYIKNMKKGHILINGNYSVLFGNPYEMLLQTIGAFNGETSLPPGNVHSIRYDFGKNILGCRSPHISTSNILISNNMEHILIDKYFNLTPEIVCINSINENVLQRLSGAD